MDNKNFNADQSIELIQRMIRDTRRNLSSGSSNLFILWGYLLAATAVGIFLLLTFTESRAWQWLWLPALAAGWAATWWYNRRRVSQVKSYTDRLLEQVWGCIAGLAAFSTFVICMEREWPVDPLFPVLLLISAGLFISGTVIHNKYMYYVSCSYCRLPSASSANRGSMSTSACWRSSRPCACRYSSSFCSSWAWEPP